MATVKETQRQASTEKMLDAALHLFAREGYTRASMSRIAEKAGMVKGSLSLRFGTKEKLFNAVQNMMWDKVQSFVDENGTAEAFLSGQLEFLRLEEKNDTDLYRFIQSFHRGNDLPPNAAEYAAGLFYGSAAERMVTRCIREGKLPPGKPEEIFLRLNLFAIGTFWNYRACGMNLPSDETILSGIWDRAVPKTAGSGDTAETLKDIGVKAVLTDYDVLFYVDVQMISSEDRVYPIHISPVFEKLCPDLRNQTHAYGFYRCLSDTLMPEEERDLFMRSLIRKQVLKVLTSEGKMTLQFRIREGAELRHYQMTMYVDYARDGSLRGYTAGIRSSEETFILSAQAANSRRIIDVLAQRYSSLYHVEAATGRMTAYSQDLRITNAFLKHNRQGADYNRALREFADLYITGGQNRETVEECTLERVLARLETESSFERFFHISDGWQNRYARVHFTRTGLPGEQGYGFVAALDTDEDRVLRHYIRQSLEEEYISIYFIDVERGIIRSYRQSDATAFGQFSSMPLEKVCRTFAKEVKPAYREQFEAFADAKNIISFIGLEDHREFNYELLGTVGTWRRSVWQIAEWNDGQPSGILVTFMSLDDESVRRFMLDNDISDTLSGRYDNVLCVDLDENRFLYSRLDEKIYAFYGRAPEQGIPFTDFAGTYIRYFVHENDRERMLAICDGAYLRPALSRGKTFSITFLSNYSGKYRYREMTFIRMPDEFGHLRFIWAFVDADDRVRFEMRRTADLQRKNNALNRISEEIIDLLGNLTEARDVQSGEHIRRVKGFTRILAAQVMRDWPEFGLTPEQVGLMSLASALHDVGKIMIPDAILLKKAPLTKAEKEIMRSHCEKGCEILSKAPKDWSEDYVRMSMEICRCHHEKYDGKGYPAGLKGEEIPVSAQIVSVADCFDALTSERAYKGAFEMEEAFRMIEEGECGAFSEKIMASFRRCRESFFQHLSADRTPYATGAAISTGAGLFSGMRFLFVDDNEINRDIAMELLQSEGAETVPAASGKEAVRIFRESPPGTFNVIMMDLVMPETDGYETARILRESETPDAMTVPIIALSSQADEGTARACFEAGMNAFLSKPMSLTDLNSAILNSAEWEPGS